MPYTKDLGIYPPKMRFKINNQPVWLLNGASINTSLHCFKKSNRNKDFHKSFQQSFLEIINKLKSLTYTPIFTDGSKKRNISFAVTTEEGNIIAGGIIPS